MTMSNLRRAETVAIFEFAVYFRCVFNKHRISRSVPVFMVADFNHAHGNDTWLPKNLGLGSPGSHRKP